MRKDARGPPQATMLSARTFAVDVATRLLPRRVARTPRGIGALPPVRRPRPLTPGVTISRGSASNFAMGSTPAGAPTYISADEARRIDEKLMGPAYGFSIDQLMELAGLSVACAIAEVYPPRTHRRVLVLAGPGNNGGDGLVAGRHLHHFGYDVQVCYPKRTPKPIYEGLVTQLETLGVEFLHVDDVKSEALVVTHDVVVDALFGFSFRGEPRHPFDELLEILNPHSAPPPIVAVDVPSGWSVDEGDVSGEGIRPDLLVSLTAPKLGAKTFTGPHHFVGGRFVPPTLASEFGLRLPTYEGSAQCARVGGGGGFSFGGGAARATAGTVAAPAGGAAAKPPGYWDSSSDDSDEE